MKSMKKAAAVVCAAALSATAVNAFALDYVDISLVIGEGYVTINGEQIEVTPAYTVADTTLVPLRVISEGLGATVDWDADTETVTVVYGDTTINLTIGSATADVNGTAVTLLAAPELTDDTAMVPIRFISETLGAAVGWEEEAMRVTITSKSDSSDVSSELAKIDNAAWNYNADDDVYWQVGIQYCANPADLTYETLGIYVPGAYMNAVDNGDGTYTCTVNADATVGGYTAETAPMVIPVNTPGYSAMSAPTGYQSSVASYTDAGFVYVNAGCRGRDHGAPAGVTDLKAAVKYIRYNADEIAGSTDRIFTFGMSGGGAQSSLMGATGDSDLYTPYLEAIGAVDGYSDAVAGSMCWCPITNLDMANEAYEWNMGITRSGLSDDMQELSDGLATAYAEYINAVGLKDADGNVLTLEESDSGIYQAGSYYDYVKSEIERSLNNFLEDTTFPYTPSSSGGGMGGMGGGRGNGGGMHGDNAEGELPDGEMPAGELPSESIDYEAIDGITRLETTTDTTDDTSTYETAEDYIASLNKTTEWVTYDSETNTATITSVEDFVTACKNASKSVGAFDDLDCAQGENTLFGYADGSGAHFDPIMAELLADNETYGAAYASDLAKTDALGNSVEYRMNMYTPLYYLSDYYEGYGTANVAQYWRIRTGINQGDTALSTEINLALALENYGRDVDFEMVWGLGHTTAERTGSSDANFIEWVNECLN